MAGSTIAKIPVSNSLRIRESIRRTPQAERLHLYFKHFSGQERCASRFTVGYLIDGSNGGRVAARAGGSAEKFERFRVFRRAQLLVRTFSKPR